MVDVTRRSLSIIAIVFRFIPPSEGVISAGDKIEPINKDRGVRHIGQIVTATMRNMRQQKDKEISLLCRRTVPRRSALKSRGGKCASAHQYSLSSDGQAREQESG